MTTQKLPSGPLAFLGVLLPGAIGLSVVVRALFVYLGHDPLASLIVVAMGAGLGVGVVELLLRVQRSLALEREVAGLPVEASEDAIEATSPALRAILRARIEHMPLPQSGESITPYLVGLMVMLGLLGTLLGLFETLRGAGHVLTSSGNVDALRTGLTGPMRGLTRSFGCSAAGVSASAMLGLAAVLVRRREGRGLSRVLGYAATSLRALSPVRRQVETLEKLASQGESLPRAAEALSVAADRLGKLAEQWEASHRAAADAQQKGLRDAFDRLQGQLSQSATEASRAVTETVAPLMAQVVTQTGEASLKHLAATTTALEKDLEARRRADAASRDALETQLKTAREEALRHVASVAEVTSTLSQSLAEARKGEREQLTALRAELERQNAALSTQWNELASEVGRATERTRSEEEARLLRLDAMTARFGTELGQLAAAMAEQLGERLERERVQVERNDQAMAALAQSGRALEDAIARQELAVSTLLEGGAEQLAKMGQASQAGVRESLEKLVEITTQQATRFTDLEAHLEQRQASFAAELATHLTGQAERLGQSMTGTTDLVREAAAVLQAASVEMGAVAEAFSHSVERQREAAQSWMESLGELEGAVERAGRGAAADALGDQLASTQEVFARQLQFQRELFEQLRSLRVGPTREPREEHDVSA